MATVLNRTTMQLLISVHTPDYPVETWIVNPDLTAVSGVPVGYWKITGDVVSEMSLAEKDAVDVTDLPALKQARFSEIDTRTGELILQGFEYPASSGDLYSLSMEAQSKMEGAYAARSEVAFTYPITWNTIDDLNSIELADVAALTGFYLTALGTMRAHLDSGTTLKDSLRAAADTAAVDAVVDGR